VTFGFSMPRWQTEKFYESSSIGRLPEDNVTFNPDAWKPRVPNQAFLHAREDDKFWAAQKLAALTTDMLRAAVKDRRLRRPGIRGVPRESAGAATRRHRAGVSSRDQPNRGPRAE
jgi:hypothetical protein